MEPETNSRLRLGLQSSKIAQTPATAPGSCYTALPSTAQFLNSGQRHRWKIINVCRQGNSAKSPIAPKRYEVRIPLLWSSCDGTLLNNLPQVLKVKCSMQFGFCRIEYFSVANVSNAFVRKRCASQYFDELRMGDAQYINRDVQFNSILACQSKPCCDLETRA